MSRIRNGIPVILINDPGLDGAVAIALALLDPRLDVAAILPSAGNISSAQATRNVHGILGHLDPKRLPRVGIAPPTEYDIDNKALHGHNGLAGLDLPAVKPMFGQSSDRLLVEMARAEPGKYTVLVMGPSSVLAAALDREPSLAALLKCVILGGGCRQHPGNCGPGIEFHFRCDPEAARKVIHAGFNLQLVPLDATRNLVISPTCLETFSCASKTGRFLRQIIPPAFKLSAGGHGIEGFPMDDLGPLLCLLDEYEIQARRLAVDVETRGEITRGMSVFDLRWATKTQPNILVAGEIPESIFCRYLDRVTQLMDPDC